MVVVGFSNGISRLDNVKENNSKERRDKEGNNGIEDNSGSDTDMEYFPENDSSNSKSEYFAAISPTAIIEQPYPQMNFFQNAKLSNLISDQATNRKKEKPTYHEERITGDKFSIDHLSMNEHIISLKLESLTRFYIRQHSNLFDTFLDFLKKNRYVVQDSEGKLIYHVFETSNNMCQCDCRTAKCSQLHFTTSTGQEMIRMEKLLKCSSFFGGRCGTHPICCIFSTSNSHQLRIESPPGLVIGAVVQQINFIRPYYQVEDAEGNPKYFIIGSTNNFSCFACCCCDIQYDVIMADKNIFIGIIIKEWTETSDKHPTIDNFNISFPRNITTKDKMLLLGALFLIANFK
uniref:Phospholipid scramblase n=1 Tax=Onchocerca volvulus TaxID=6282 RepID=A0A8R1Y2S7_ONCVO